MTEDIKSGKSSKLREGLVFFLLFPVGFLTYVIVNVLFLKGIFSLVDSPQMHELANRAFEFPSLMLGAWLLLYFLSRHLNRHTVILFITYIAFWTLISEYNDNYFSRMAGAIITFGIYFFVSRKINPAQKD